MKSAKATGGNQQERLEPSWGELECALAFQQGWAERKLLFPFLRLKTALHFYSKNLANGHVSLHLANVKSQS